MWRVVPLPKLERRKQIKLYHSFCFRVRPQRIAGQRASWQHPVSYCAEKLDLKAVASCVWWTVKLRFSRREPGSMRKRRTIDQGMARDGQIRNSAPCHLLFPGEKDMITGDKTKVMSTNATGWSKGTPFRNEQRLSSRNWIVKRSSFVFSGYEGRGGVAGNKPKFMN